MIKKSEEKTNEKQKNNRKINITEIWVLEKIDKIGKLLNRLIKQIQK